MLSARDREISLEIERKIRKIEVCQRELTMWRKKAHDNVRECMARNCDMRRQKDGITHNYYILKEHLSRFRAVHERSLKNTTGFARDCRQNVNLRWAKFSRFCISLR